MTAPTIFSFFAEAFSVGLDLDARLAEGKVAKSSTEVYGRLAELLNQARTRASAAGKRPQDVEDAAFAVAAWLDELIARHPQWWVNATPLQVTLFQTNNAGNEFFDHLQRLAPAQDEVREVYYMAMCLGFLGQYFFESGEGGDLGRLKDVTGRQLPLPPAPLATLRDEKITSQPYQMKDPAGVRLPGHLDELLLKLGIALALLIPLGYLLYYLLIAPKPAPIDLQQLADQALARFQCAELAGRAGPDKVVTVSGFVQTPEDVSRVRAELEKLPSLKAVRADVKVRIWPYCEVVEILRPFKLRNDEGRLGLSIAPTAGHDDRFVEGERVIVQLAQPSYDGYLYVDYYVIDGTVVHMFPNAREPDSGAVFRAGARPRVGERIECAEDRKQMCPWKIGPPFGQELITVVASPAPLYRGTLPEAEPAEQYLKRLREMVEANKQDPRFAASFLFLQTQPR